MTQAAPIAGIVRTRVAGLRVDAIPRFDLVTTFIDHALRKRKWRCDGTSYLITFANPATAVSVRRNETADLFERFDLVAPDGIAMVKTIQWVHRIPALRMSFDSTSLAPAVMALACKHGSGIVLCGGQPGVADQARQRLLEAYPGLTILGVFDGYSDRRTTIDAIRGLAPDIVVCGMGVLLQESFLISLTDSGWAGIGFTCGGYLDQLVNGLRYYPKAIDKFNIRFAYRLAKEPRRLWRRYLLDYPLFVISLMEDRIRPKGQPE